MVETGCVACGSIGTLFIRLALRLPSNSAYETHVVSCVANDCAIGVTLFRNVVVVSLT